MNFKKNKIKYQKLEMSEKPNSSFANPNRPNEAAKEKEAPDAKNNDD
jgi:hypothetical protein